MFGYVGKVSDMIGTHSQKLALHEAAQMPVQNVFIQGQCCSMQRPLGYRKAVGVSALQLLSCRAAMQFWTTLTMVLHHQSPYTLACACALGLTVGLTAQPSSDQQQQQQEQGAQANSSQLGAASYASNSGTAAYQQAAENELEEFVEHQEKDFVWAKGSQNQYGTEEGDPSREDMARRLLGADQQKNSSKQGANQQKNKPEWPVMITTVNADNWRQRVPETFLATSHEYVRIFDYGDERKVHAWANVFKKLSYSPIIRIGGASQDKMTKVPGDDTWLALKKLKDHANAR